MLSTGKNMFRAIGKGMPRAARMQKDTRSFSNMSSLRKSQYLATFRDHSDPDALQRRLSVRESHLEVARKLKNSDKIIEHVAALLDENDRMVGSMFIINADSEAEVKEVLQKDLYYTSNVWDKDSLYIHKIRKAPI
ncbi:hypothetical protein AX774_g7298 [Zancudomyces culisetae]|uniref:YCII-related domain-containing protein n=1 Tax=Zancudomyces culisetae TaxID=1213189 RepID=A0A1R1PEG8_ZANCU|nr:hypothetical protein AX774_g7298 [Zancudomyces culisetae]|eukprot:OMH79303.1 hypothetical protein AX774_g7298 [Zancudomyces culisetae]